jgi:hypothetical protein
MRLRNPWIISYVVVVFATALGMLLYLQYIGGKKGIIRTVRSNTGSGVLMAVDADGLRQLSELYSWSQTCTEANLQPGSGILTKICLPKFNFTERPMTSQMINKGVVLIPEGTTGLCTGRRFVLPGGRLVEPYAANEYDMERDGVIEVERIRITRPPSENLEGWVEIHFLGRRWGL